MRAAACSCRWPLCRRRRSFIVGRCGPSGVALWLLWGARGRAGGKRQAILCVLGVDRSGRSERLAPASCARHRLGCGRAATCFVSSSTSLKLAIACGEEPLQPAPAIVVQVHNDVAGGVLNVPLQPPRLSLYPFTRTAR